MSIINFTVEYDALASLTDSADMGADADVVALVGTVTFTPVFVDKKPVLAPGYDPRPAGLTIRPFVGVVDTDGQLKAAKGGAVGVRLWANDPVLELTDLTYKVDFNLSTTLGERIEIEGGYFEAPDSDQTINLADVLASTGSPSVSNLNQVEVYAHEIVDSGSTGVDLMQATTQLAARDAISAVGRGDFVVNAKDYGLAEAATAAANVTAITNAMAALPDLADIFTGSDGNVKHEGSGGGVVIIPPGKYSINAPIVVPPRTEVHAEGVTLVATHSSACVKFNQDPVTGLFAGLNQSVTGLIFDGADIATNGFWLQSTLLSKLESCTVYRTTGNAFRLEGTQYAQLVNCFATECAGWGLSITRNTNSTAPDGNNNTITRFFSEFNTLGGVKVGSGAIANTFVGLTAQFTSGYGILFASPDAGTATSGNAVFSAHFERNGIDIEFQQDSQGNHVYAPAFSAGPETVRHVINNGYRNGLHSPHIQSTAGPQVRRAGTTACYEIGPAGGEWIVTNPVRLTGSGNFSADGSKMFVKADGTEFDPSKKNLGGNYIAVIEAADPRQVGETRFAKTIMSGTSSTDEMMSVRYGNDTDDRLIVRANGTLVWGNGAGTEDATLTRSGTGKLAIDGAEIITSTGSQAMQDKTLAGVTNITGTDPGFQFTGVGYVTGASSAGSYSNIAAAGDMVLRGSGKGVVVTACTDTGVIKFGTGASDSEKVRITNDGKVGIGTASPSVALEVNGAAKVDSVELGAATDTTITRASAGAISVEGNPVGLKVSAPSTLTSAGKPGQWAAATDGSYLYHYTGDGSTHTWSRTTECLGIGKVVPLWGSNTYWDAAGQLESTYTKDWVDIYQSAVLVPFIAGRTATLAKMALTLYSTATTNTLARFAIYKLDDMSASSAALTLVTDFGTVAIDGTAGTGIAPSVSGSASLVAGKTYFAAVCTQNVSGGINTATRKIYSGAPSDPLTMVATAVNFRLNATVSSGYPSTGTLTTDGSGYQPAIFLSA